MEGWIPGTTAACVPCFQCPARFVCGRVNPLYLAYITLRVQLQQSSREVLVVGRPCDQLLLKCSDLVFQRLPVQRRRLLQRQLWIGLCSSA